MKNLNLVLDPWIKIRFHERVSILDFFNLDDSTELDGLPPERFVVFRLLLAILQAACVDADTDLDELEELNIVNMKERAKKYLMEHKDEFWLYGYKNKSPFLQYNKVVSGDKKSFSVGDLVMGVCTGNATLLYESNRKRDICIEDEVYVLLLQTILAFSGKKPDSNIVLAEKYTKKKSSPASPTLGHCRKLSA